jgi:hypothetical protein
MGDLNMTAVVAARRATVRSLLSEVNRQLAVGVWDVEGGRLALFRRRAALEIELIELEASLDRLFASEARVVPTSDALQPLESQINQQVKVKAPPGHRLLTWAELLYSRKTYEFVFQQAVYDMRDEYHAALEAGRWRKAKWVHIAGVARVLMAAAGVSLSGLLRIIARQVTP